jgi:hypothetical protein
VSFLVKKGTFTAKNGGTNNVITGVGFRPKAIILWCVAQTADGFGASYSVSLGFGADPTGSSLTQCQMSAWASDAVASTTSFSGVTSDDANIINLNSITAGNIYSDVPLISLDSDGFTLGPALGNNASGAYVIHYLALGGTDITNAKVFEHFPVIPVSGTSSQAFTGLGFAPDFLAFLSSMINTATTGKHGITSSTLGFGAAVRNGGQIGSGWSDWPGGSKTNVTTTEESGTAIIAPTGASGAGDSQDMYGSVTSFDADGFTALFTHFVTLGTMRNFALALQGGLYYVGQDVQPVGPTPGKKATSGFGFKPSGMLFFGNGLPAQHGVAPGDMRYSFGGSDGQNQGALWLSSLDGVATTSERQFNSSAYAYAHCTQDSQIDSSMVIDSFDPNGYTSNWTIVDPTPRAFGVVAFGAGADFYGDDDPPVLPAQPDLIVEISFDGDPTANFNDTVLNDGPKVYYRLNELSGTTAVDQMGLVNGTYTGTSGTNYNLGVSGGLTGDPDVAANFDGSAGYVSIATNATIDAIVAAWAVEVWVYPTAARDGGAGVDTVCGIVTRQYSGASGIPWSLQYGRLDGNSWAANKVRIAFWSGAAWAFCEDPLALPLNTWTHFIGGWDGTSLRLWKNGLKVNTITPGITPAATAAAQGTFIGKRWDGGGTTPFFPGRIDEPAVYNFNFTDQGAAAHFRAAKVPSTYTWTDISADVTEVSTRRGRQYELDRIEAGTAAVTVDDTNRKYDPANTLSPYYPNVTVLKMIRVRAANNEVLNPDFEADVSNWTSVASATLSRDTAHLVYGTASMKVVTPGSVTKEGASSNGVTVVSGDEVRASVQVNAPNTIAMQVRIEEYDATPTLLRTTVQTLVGNGAFQLVKTQAVTGASTVTTKIVIATNATIATTFYVDAAQLKRVYPVYRGYVERWPEVWEGINYGSVTITAVDGMEPLQQAQVQGTVVTGLSGAMVNAVLNMGNWSRALRSLEVGQSTMATQVAAVGSTTTAKSIIQTLADSEVGLFFFSAAGWATFQDRSHRSGNTLSTVSQATLSDMSDGNIEFAEGTLFPSFDKDRVVNDWQVTPDPSISTVPQEVTDETSIRKYFRRTGQKGTALSLSADALTTAQYLTLHTAKPAYRFDSIGIDPLNNIVAWRACFQRDISDRVTVLRNPNLKAPAGSPITFVGYIEEITWAMRAGEAWRCSWQLSPADSTLIWTLNDATLGKLDNGNVLGF